MPKSCMHDKDFWYIGVVEKGGGCTDMGKMDENVVLLLIWMRLSLRKKTTIQMVLVALIIILMHLRSIV